jgi:Flp pilus assembly protein TadG
MSLVTGIQKRIATLFDRRRAPRRRVAVRAFYWDGVNSAPHDVRDISAVGAYIVTDMKWYSGTLLDLIIEPGVAHSSNGQRPPLSHRMSCKVVRVEADGIGVEFLHHDKKQRRNFAHLLGKMAIEGSKMASHSKSEHGQSLIEFSLILPLLLLLIVNVVNFGAFFYAWVTVANAARAGAQYMVMAGATVGAPEPPSAAQVAALVTSDASSLPNSGSLQVRVCTLNGTAAPSCTGSGSTLAPPADPEASGYVVATVDVNYTYQPLIPSFSFAALRIRTTLPPTAMHRRTVMRMLQ